jgi:hypothetical protein
MKDASARARRERRIGGTISVLLLALLWLGMAPARAADIDFGGEFRVRGFSTNNLSDLNSHINDTEAFVDGRVRLKVSATQGIATGVVMVDFFNGNQGQDVATLNSSAVGDGTGNRTLGSEGFGGSLDSIRLKEGYLRVSWPAFHLVVGRQAVTLGHGLILDDWVDAVSVAIPMGWASLTFSDLIIDNQDNGSDNTSGYLADLNISPTSGFRSGLFLFYLNDRGPNLNFNETPYFFPCGIATLDSCPLSDFGNDKASLSIVGWTMDGKGESYDWATELNYLNGAIRTNDPTALNPAAQKIGMRGSNALIRVGWIPGAVDVHLTGIYASGQNPNDLPPVGHKLNINAVSANFVLGNILVNNETISDRDGGSIGGLTAGKLAVGWRPVTQVRTELAWILARLTERPASDASRVLGSEFDANASWQLEHDLLLTGGFGILLPGEAWMTLLADSRAKNSAIKLSTALNYKF